MTCSPKTCWIIIPAKAPPVAKGRLARALSGDDRERLARAMLRTALDAAIAVVGSDRVLLVGTAWSDTNEQVEWLDEPEGGLNAALTHARAEAARRGASRVVSLAADLPLVTADDVKALVDLPEGTAAIAPDRHGTGTNALSLPLPGGLDFTYHYGIGSCAMHKAEAARVMLDLAIIELPGLARDIDEPADLPDAQGLLAKLET